MGARLLAGVVALTGLTVAGAVAYAVFPSASNQGYAPEQPIPFSHRLHAGVHKIDCRYCHVGVEKSRHASVPALNVCMNCHRVVKTDSPWIQKLQAHYNENKPIEWVRIHELPDHVAFNHRPHVAKGISCETCHGDVQSMDKVVQKAPLTMGWCLDCHRGVSTPTSVLADIHKDLLKSGKNLNELRGQHVAPTNCSTCHY